MRITSLQRKDSGTSIDLTPMIDMMFILILFFTVSATFVKDMKLDLERPAASSSVASNNKEVRVHLERTGALWLDGAPVKPWMLQSRLREALESSADKQVLVVTDRLVPAEKLIEVVDQCRLAGAADVGVATSEEAG